MLSNEYAIPNEHVKFIEYTGSFPKLCRGNLLLEIDGVQVWFGHTKECKYKAFWSSGGHIDSDRETYFSGEWVIDVEEIPEQYRKYAVEIDRAFNANVYYGCCGGCFLDI